MFQPAADLPTEPPLTPELEEAVTSMASVLIGDDGDVLVVDVDVDVDAVPERKPHFLDYDAVPPPEYAEEVSYGFGPNAAGEQLKMDKKYERDGEVSDYELAASGYTKKEFTQDDNTLQFTQQKLPASKAKHFLDENPIPPDYMLAQELREHRSLDRNFERQAEQQQQRNASPATSLSGGRKNSMEHSGSSRVSRERNREPSYTLSRFLDGDTAVALLPMSRVPKGAAWTEEHFDEPYGSDVDATLGSKVECVYSLLSMLGSNDPLEMSKKFLELSTNPQTCATLRRSGCMPLLVQMMHASDNDEEVRKCASLALHNVVHSHPDEKAGRRETKVLRLLDQIMDYCNFLKTLLQSGGEAIADDSDRHPLAAISSLMKVSFDEEHRHAMCELGALQAIPNLVHLDHAVHGPKPEDQCCNSLRRYALMALTNLTFGDENNKALLCGQKQFMEALVAQLDSAPDDLLQVTASVLRNLSWRADKNMKAVLNEIGTVTALALAAMKNKSENTLKAILSALWNLSAHCSTNKAEFCAVDGALAFLVKMLSYEGPSKTLKIIENAGGILRNVSSHIAVCEPYRQILREHNCLAILLQQLKSESLTVVSNSCGTLWNLSARCPEDQKFLWDNGAVPMLRSLIHSKHAMISEGSSSALKNLLNFRPAVQNPNHLDPIARSMGLKKLPTLNVRKQKALQQELGEKQHAETCDNLDMGHSTSQAKERIPASNLELLTRKYPLVAAVGGSLVGAAAVSSSVRLTRSAMLTKSESRDSVFSAKSDTAYEHLMRSQSASDATRQTPKLPQYVQSTAVAFELEQEDTEATEEQPIDYSAKYNNESAALTKTDATSTYQETDLDQPTDFSLRYAENQIESDLDISPPEVASNGAIPKPPALTAAAVSDAVVKPKNENGQEILLILEDSVKCYQTEDTPYVISNAASVTDLRQAAKAADAVSAEHEEKPSGLPSTVAKKQPPKLPQYGSGSYTPEKPINYCEEGTPGYFSRYDSLSSLDDAAAAAAINKQAVPAAAVSGSAGDVDVKPGKLADEAAKPSSNCEQPQLTEVVSNSALETPLMFSRRSSMDSLVNEDVGACDDKSSVVSDFSRLASGVISPSELPDSPTQSMPQSPRRNSMAGAVSGGGSNQSPLPARSVASCKRPLRSVFEDDLSTFNVEHTPAQFSCATSLSNLSIADDEQPLQSNGNNKIGNSTRTSAVGSNCAAAVPSEGEEDEANLNNNDDLLLASCINMGMNHRSVERKPSKQQVTANLGDEPRPYYTEDTPALLSKVGSNTNLSAISINSSVHNEMEGGSRQPQTQRYSLNLSDDVSSNASECGAAAQSADLLQQCIREGMQKSSTNAAKQAAPVSMSAMDPIAMLRRGGNVLPAYLPVGDEMNKYLVEDSPCNFSVVSGLSNLTVGSSLVGPAVQLQGSNGNSIASHTMSKEQATLAAPQEDVRRQPQWQDDSLSSLSIDSEDDTNLLSQAIAAGCNRPKSNLGFSSTTSTSKRSNSSSSQATAIINAATSASSLNSVMTARNFQRQLKNRAIAGAAAQHNESSSVDSSDSNDNQSKSLLELCILKGMYKSKEPGATRKHTADSTQSNPNLKQFDSLPVQLMQPKSHTASRQQHNRHHHHHHHHRERERERKDEKLLQECINTGISKKIGSTALPKNAPATSAAALEPCHPMAATTSASVSSTAAPDVEKTAHTLTSFNNSTSSKQSSNYTEGAIIDAAKSQVHHPNHAIAHTIKANGIGCRQSTGDNDDRSSDESNQSFIMETMVRLDTVSTCNLSSSANEKHKDPDLMLKSVERLTLEFVTSAEQLRTSSASVSASLHEENSRKRGGSNTNSHNTWNENTCPNDVSFPSVSVSVPKLAELSFNDDYEVQEPQLPVHTDLHDFAEITPTNEGQMLPGTQPNSLETETDTLVNERLSQSSGLNFQLGGQVQSAAAVQQQPLLFNGTSASIMTNSAMIAFEARALAANLQQLQVDDDEAELTFSINSLDLDNVRPPSGMESLNISGCYHDHTSTQPSSLQLRYAQLPTKSPKFLRRAFPANLVAKRALGQLAGSAESVNSSCNLLDNVKPPSLMDELLDSMISVDSIQSEVADGHGECSLATTISVSNYETAAGGPCDDTVTVLQSCCENMPCDEDHFNGNDDDDEDATMNFSSAESTPKQGGSTPSPNRRTTTPKQKRRLAKDRYKTYTIATEVTAQQQQDQQGQGIQLETEETLQIEIVETSPRAIRRRRGSAERYKTQVIECPRQVFERDDCPSEELSSIRAMMQKFTYITDINIGNGQAASLTDDCHSMAADQNSETESCHGQEEEHDEQQTAEHQARPAHASDQIVEAKPNVKKTAAEQTALATAATNVKAVRGRKKPAYVSPYSMQGQRNSSVNNANANKNKTLAPTIAKRQPPINANGTRLTQMKKPATKTTPTQSPAARLERQGTFVKDEPTNKTAQVPVVEAKAATATTPTGSSPSRRNSKLPMKRTNTASAGGKATTPAASPKRNVVNGAARKLTATTTKPAATAGPMRANTNTIRLSSAKAAARSSRMAIQAARVSATTPPSRSNSNLNGNTATAAAAAKINQAQSRIASIWKRVDEVKTKQAKQQSQPKGATSNLKTQQTKSSNTINGTSAAAAQKPTLLRSSTFDNTPPPPEAVPKAVSPGKSKLPVVGRK